MIVYKITHLVNGKIYVGITIKTLEYRFAKHISDCKYYSHYFAKALSKHGAESFSIEQIDSASTKEELMEKEKYWISKLKSTDPSIGYNGTAGGEGVVGDSEESRRRRSESKKGSKNPMFGKKLSDKAKKQLSERSSGSKNYFYGKPGTNLGKTGAQSHMYGRKLPEDTRRKMSESQRARHKKTEVVSD